jgi:hypothetical protein
VPTLTCLCPHSLAYPHSLACPHRPACPLRTRVLTRGKRVERAWASGAHYGRHIPPPISANTAAHPRLVLNMGRAWGGVIGTCAGVSASGTSPASAHSLTKAGSDTPPTASALYRSKAARTSAASVTAGPLSAPARAAAPGFAPRRGASAGTGLDVAATAAAAAVRPKRTILKYTRRAMASLAPYFTSATCRAHRPHNCPRRFLNGWHSDCSGCILQVSRLWFLHSVATMVSAFRLLSNSGHY